MFISELCIKNFRCFKEETKVSFNEGINVLIGHNNAGKSSILKAFGIIFDNNSSKNLKVDDFNRNVSIKELKEDPPMIQISAKLQESEQEEDYSDDIVTVATWLTKLDRPYEAQITYIFSLSEKENDDYKKVMKKLTSDNIDDYWYEIEQKFLRKYTYKVYIGDISNRVTIDAETLKKFDFQFLDAIRDVERDLYSGRNTLLKEVIDYFIDYDIKNNTSLTIEKQQEELSNRKENFSKDTSQIMKTLQKRLETGKKEMLQYAENTGATFDGSKPSFTGRILDTDFYSALKLVIESSTGIKIPADQNGLGYNNLIYISLLLAKMQKDASGEYFGSNAKVYPMLVIEEPEAHLHPSMQYKFLKFLRENKQAHVRQIFITTHSPNITAAVHLDDIIVLHKNAAQIEIAYPGKVFTDDKAGKISKDYVERFLDVTKSDMLFAKNIILVEGIAEQLLLPVFARMKGGDLTDCHIAIINIGGRYFDHFLKLFDTQLSNHAINKKVACITDLDPQYRKEGSGGQDVSEEDEEEKKNSWKSCYPFELDMDANYKYNACSNSLIEKVNSNNIRVFSQMPAEGCTLEYEIIKNNFNLEDLITTNVQNAKELRTMMGQTTYLDACKYLRKSPENNKIQEALDKKTEWADLQKVRHLIAARYLNSVKKGQTAQELAQLLSDSEKKDVQEKFVVPNYLTEAITWICK